MKLLICEHLAKPIKGRRADFLLLILQVRELEMLGQDGVRAIHGEAG